LALLGAVLMLLIATTSTTWGAAKSVTVTLPNFQVTLNGMAIDNTTRKYPLIVYKDITYFPMTYYDCRFLGIESKWKAATGLEITKAGVPQSYNAETGSKNAGKYIATIVQTPIKVNGKNVDNSMEPYPLLLFRNVTYFPLTYRFAAEEFDWDYKFDAKTGLSINEKSGAAQQGQTAFTEVTLPIVNRSEGIRGAFTMVGDYFYYEGKNGKIYQAPISDTSKVKEVYSLPKSGIGSDYVYAGLHIKNNQAILTYHIGGATMGSDYVIRLNPDGTNETIDSGYSYLEDFGDITIRVNQGVPPFTNNLTIKYNKNIGTANDQFESIGDPNYIYGWDVEPCSDGTSYGRSKNLYLRGDQVFVLGCRDARQEDSHIGGTGHISGVYIVNIKTDETERITKNSARAFQIHGDTLYFLSGENMLYKKSLAFSEGGVVSNVEELMATGMVNEFVVTNGHVFYATAEYFLPDDKRYVENGQLYKVGSTASLNPKGIVAGLEVQEGYVIATFTAESESPYKLMVINKDGTVIYKTSEEASRVFINNGQLVFVKN